MKILMGICSVLLVVMTFKVLQYLSKYETGEIENENAFVVKVPQSLNLAGVLCIFTGLVCEIIFLYTNFKNDSDITIGHFLIGAGFFILGIIIAFVCSRWSIVFDGNSLTCNRLYKPAVTISAEELDDVNMTGTMFKLVSNGSVITYIDKDCDNIDRFFNWIERYHKGADITANNSKYEITNKNLFHIATSLDFKMCIFAILSFAIISFWIMSDKRNFGDGDVLAKCFLMCFGIFIAAIEFLYRSSNWKKRIKMLNEAMDTDIFSQLSGKRLNYNRIYKDDEWFVAVTPVDCIIFNKNYMKKDIETVLKKGRVLFINIHMNNGKVIENQIDVRDKYCVDQLMEWIGAEIKTF